LLRGSSFIARNTHSLKTFSRAGWALLCALIVYGSLGTWSHYQPGIWAPTLVSRRDVAVNVLLYVPFGALGFLSLRDGYRRPWPRLVARLMLLAALFSGANEVFQLYTIDRVASLTDIASAAAGALAGGVAIALWREPR
jgi:VanZ family protein